MVFSSPSWVPSLPFDPPDSIPISEFMLNEEYGRYPISKSKPPFTCGLSGKQYSAAEVKHRVENLARALAHELGWEPNKGAEWDKVIGVFSVNTIDTLTLSWAVHRNGGISSPANAAYSHEELAHQLTSSGSGALFTCIPLLPIALKAAATSGIPKNRIYLLSVPEELASSNGGSKEYKTVDELIRDGEHLGQLEELRWEEGTGAKRTAFLCYSSGTSGLPKAVMISHRNVIANVLMISTYEQPYREMMKKKTGSDYLDIALGLLPQSHIYALVVVCHASMYRGDGVINLPKFEVKSYLNAIQKYKINTLYLVPPIIILMTKNKKLCDEYDLSSVQSIFTGAAPLGTETAQDLQKQRPKWIIRQGYGLTETSTVVCSTTYDDIDFGSSGSILPGCQCRIVTVEGNDVEGENQPGELWVKSPSVVLGYMNNDQANKETFVDGWMRTGDEAIIRKSPKGNYHIWIIDRLKELIKVKGLQVAPAELEAYLLTHPAVSDCAVIPVPDDAAGEVPKAFVVKSPSVGIEDNDRMLARDIQKHVEKAKARHKWLKGGVEFVDEIPKSPSGKILRRLLRDKEKEARRKKGAKL